MAGSATRAEDVAWGVRWGLSFAFCYAVVALLLYSAGGALSLLAGVVAAYVVAGVAAGAVVGLLRRRLDTVPGVLAASVAAGLPTWAALGSVGFERLPHAWGRSEWISYVVCVLVVGPIMGLTLHRRQR